MKRHIISQPAIKDLEEIIDYFSNHNVSAGKTLSMSLRKNVNILLIFLILDVIMIILSHLYEV